MKIFRKIQTDCTLKQREKFADFLALNSEKSFLEKTNYLENISENEKDNFNKIRSSGYFKPSFNEKSLIFSYTDDVLDYFKNASGYDSHVPIYANKRTNYTKNGDKSDSGYISFDTGTVLNCPQIRETLLEISKNKSIAAYLKCRPRLYSCNTFWTFPKNEKLLTHSWHRDLDDFKFLSVFIFWTETNEENGYIKFIEGSHNHLNHKSLLSLSKSIWLSKSKNNTYTNFPSKKLRDKFYRINKEVPNGYGFDSLYERIFWNNIVKLYGPPGTYIICDTFGLHSGSSVIKPRLVTWFRFGLYENLAWHYDKNVVSKEHLNLIEKYNSTIKDIDFSLITP